METPPKTIVIDFSNCHFAEEALWIGKVVLATYQKSPDFQPDELFKLVNLLIPIAVYQLFYRGEGAETLAITKDAESMINLALKYHVYFDDPEVNAIYMHEGVYINLTDGIVRIW